MNDDPKYAGRDRDNGSESTIDPFDRKYWELRDIGVRSTEATITVVDGLTATTFILQTIRVRELGDYLFLQRVASEKERTVRIVLPPRVTEALARQRDTVTKRVRQKVGRAAAADRKAQGLPSGFAAMTPEARAAALEKAQKARKAKARKRKARKAARR